MWKKYQPNPCGRSVGDCSVRAVAKALNLNWEEAYALLAAAGYKMCDMPSADATISAVLRENGFYREPIPERHGMYYTAAEFAADHPQGVYVLFFGGHVATVKNGTLYDAWDSSNEIPQYVWYRKG